MAASYAFFLLNEMSPRMTHFMDAFLKGPFYIYFWTWSSSSGLVLNLLQI